MKPLSATPQGHTPGPWESTKNRYGAIQVGPADGLAIAEVWLRGYSDREWANAKLLAAAPDLLEACEAMLDARYSAWHRFADEGEPEPEDMQAARAAVKKAREA